MKKAMSIMLASLMLVSLFAVNVSASIEAGIPAQTVSLFEDFNDAEYKLPLTGNAAANYTVADGDKAHSARKTGVSVNLPEQYTLEFDMLFEDNQYRPVNQMFIYINDADCSTVKNFGVKLMDGSFKLDTWYTIKLVVDESKMSGTNDLSGTAHVKMYQKLKGEDTYKESTHTNGSDGTVSSDETFVYRSHTAYADTNNVLGDNAIGFNSYMVFDNVKVSWIKDAVPYPVIGVLHAEDFEGKTPSLIGSQGSLVTEDGNSYMEMYLKSTGAEQYNAEKDTYAASYGSSGTVNFDSMPQYFILTADICMATDNTQPFLFEYFTDDINNANVAGETANIKITTDKVTAGEWYTVKIVKTGNQKFTATMVNLETGETTTPAVNTTNNISGRGTYNRALFRIINEGSDADKVHHWLIDNVMIAELGAAALKGATVADGTVTAELSMDAGVAVATPVLALYKEGRLVAVDYSYNEATFGVDGADVTLTATGDYDQACVLLWNDGTPVMEEFDITSNL